MTVTTVTTGIKIGVPTRTGTIYTAECVQQLITNFNPNSPSAFGGILDRGAIEQGGNVTHRVKRLFLRNGELMAELEVLDLSLDEALRGGRRLTAKPITVNPLNQPAKPLLIRRIDVEEE